VVIPVPQIREGQALINCARLRDQLARDGIYRSLEELTWRIAPEPFWLTSEEYAFIKELGNHLLAFYSSLNKLYFESLKGRQPPWVSRNLDHGKPDPVITYGRMNRFKQHLPGIIRPDLIPTDQGFIATELDSIPGGIGLTGNLSVRYAELGYRVVEGSDGMVQGFARMIRDIKDRSTHSGLAIIVSDESGSYRPEMRWLGERLNEIDLLTAVIEPDDIQLTEEGLRVPIKGNTVPVDVVYRFFELFDLKNISKFEQVFCCAKKKEVMITPPLKAYLEEKMAFALFHHPVLEPFWTAELGIEAFSFLKKLIPHTWILDPQPVPSHAVVPDLYIHGRPLMDWQELTGITQKERHLVIKPSGFSELAWGSRGVIVGHDHSQKEWSAAIERALVAFSKGPHIIQTFFKGKKYSISYYDDSAKDLKPMTGRVRLSPYYFVYKGKAELGGILATLCPLDKKLLHGMTEAVMVPCAVQNRD
jgi:hypothetical protein